MTSTIVDVGLRLRFFARFVLPAIIGVFVLLFGATQPAAAAPLWLAQSGSGVSLDSYGPGAGIPASGDSQHAMGGNPSGGTAGGDPCASNMSDHCGNSGSGANSASNNPCASNMSDHCGNKGNGTTAADNKSVTATALVAPAIADTATSTPAAAPGKPAIPLDKPVASGPPLVLTPQH